MLLQRMLLLGGGPVQRQNPKESTFVSSNPLGEIFARHADLCLATQLHVLDSVDALTQAWLDRSREGVDAARAAMQQMVASKDAGDMLRVQQQWFSGALRRTVDNISELGTGLSSAGSKAVASFERESRNAAGPHFPLNEEMMKAAGNKPRRKKPA